MRTLSMTYLKIISYEEITKSNNDTLAVRNMSCYTSEKLNCITGNYNNCKNNAIGGKVTIPISIDNNRNSRSSKIKCPIQALKYWRNINYRRN
jgi:hypothetical protein